MKIILFALVTLLARGCENGVADSTEARLAIEGTSCAEITSHAVDAPAPDCLKILEAFIRGRDRVLQKYPAARNTKMARFVFFQTAVAWNSVERFPRMRDAGAIAETTNCLTVPFITYAFEEAIEHEVVHAMVCLLDGRRERAPEAVAAPGDEDQQKYKYVYEIACHDTSDDAFGDGASISASRRASCIRPYSGPPNPGADGH